MAPDKNCIIQCILTKKSLVSTSDVEAHVLEHQDIHSRLRKSDRKGTSESSNHQAHMCRLLDGLSDEQQITMNYLMSAWNDRSKASAINVFKMGLKLNKDLGKSGYVFEQLQSLENNERKNKR